MLLKFEKWHGAKNDFILTWLQGDDKVIFDSLQRQAFRLCNRDGSGISADGILVMHISDKEQIFPDKLSIINSDGSIAETCGNGIRCAALSILKRHRYYNPREIPESFELNLRTSKVMCRFLGKGKLEGKDYWPLISVDMGIPQLNDSSEKFTNAQKEVERVSDELQKPELQNDWAYVDISNEHLVFFLDEVDRDLLLNVGPAFQVSNFWDGINVHLVMAKEVLKKDRSEAANKLGHTIDELYDVYVWERGAGETKACGSGACAVATAALNSGMIDRSQWLGIDMPGGRLYTKQAGNEDPVTLAGPAQFIFEGCVEI